MQFSYIHISDIHLGRPFSDLPEAGQKMDACNNACKNAMNMLVETAINRNVDFVLIAGDSFDDEEQDLSTKLLFIKSLKKLADNNIKSFVICGNHDSINIYNKFKNYFNFDEHYQNLINITGITTNDNKYKFTPIEGVNIYSLSFQTDEMKSPISQLKELGEVNKNEFNIGLIHCDIDKTDSKYAPVSREDLRRLNYDYYALGHIHIPQDKDDNIIYAGTLQSRNIKESDKHGGFLITVKDNKIISKEFITFDSVRFFDIKIDCSELNNKLDVFDKIFETTSDNCVNDVKLSVFRVSLLGVSEAYFELNESENLLDEYIENYSENNHNCGICSIINKTSPFVDDNEIISDNGVVGIIANSLNSQDIFEEIYSEISDIHSNIYKKLSIDKDSQSFLLKSMEKDKSELFEEVKKELKHLCKEVYNNSNK